MTAFNSNWGAGSGTGSTGIVTLIIAIENRAHTRLAFQLLWARFVGCKPCRQDLLDAGLGRKICGTRALEARLVGRKPLTPDSLDACIGGATCGAQALDARFVGRRPWRQDLLDARLGGKICWKKALEARFVGCRPWRRDLWNAGLERQICWMSIGQAPLRRQNAERACKARICLKKALRDSGSTPDGASAVVETEGQASKYALCLQFVSPRTCNEVSLAWVLKRTV